MAKRILIFAPDGTARMAIDWRHSRDQLTEMINTNLREGEVAVEVTAAGTDSLDTMMRNVHRCRAAMRGAAVEDVHFFQADEQGQVTARSRLKQPDRLISQIARRQHRKSEGAVIMHSRREATP